MSPSPFPNNSLSFLNHRLWTPLSVAGMDTNREFLLVTRPKGAATRRSSRPNYKAHIIRSVLLM